MKSIMHKWRHEYENSGTGPAMGRQEKIRGHMADMLERYKKLASQTHTFTWQERQLAEGRKELYDAIRQALGL